MNKVIKFKCWHLTAKKWLIVDNMPLVPYDSESLVYEFGEGWVEFVQYTGLKDKNGNEIFEGDILKSGVEPWLVMWHPPCFKMFRQGKFAKESFIHEKVEIIGNRFQNFELINKD